jgi:hypothetical protein
VSAPIPKGSSLTLEVRDKLGKPSVVQGRCICCGDRRDEQHHDPTKQQVPSSLTIEWEGKQVKAQSLCPTYSVCGWGSNGHKCHGVLQQFGSIRQTETGVWLRIGRSDSGPEVQRAIKALNRLRVANGFTSVVSGREFPAIRDHHLEA